MKKVIILLIVLVSGLVLAQNLAWDMEMSASTRCIPAKDPVAIGRTITAWSNGITTVAGGYYSNTAGEVFFAITSAVSTNMPALAQLDKTSDAVEWFRCNNMDWKRGITICVLSGSESHYNINADATTNNPYLNNRTFTGNNSDSDYYVIPNSGTNRVAIIIQ